jgi:hypothetical protein
MLMFNTWNLHNFMQNYIAIMTTNKLKCNLMYVTSKHHKFKTNIIRIKFILFYFVSFLHFKSHEFCMNILFNEFFPNSIEISQYWILWWICNLKITLKKFILNYKYLDLSWDVKNFTILDVFDENMQLENNLKIFYFES